MQWEHMLDSKGNYKSDMDWATLSDSNTSQMGQGFKPCLVSTGALVAERFKGMNSFLSKKLEN